MSFSPTVLLITSPANHLETTPQRFLRIFLSHLFDFLRSAGLARQISVYWADLGWLPDLTKEKGCIRTREKYVVNWNHVILVRTYTLLEREKEISFGHVIFGGIKMSWFSETHSFFARAHDLRSCQSGLSSRFAARMKMFCEAQVGSNVPPADDMAYQRLLKVRTPILRAAFYFNLLVDTVRWFNYTHQTRWAPSLNDGAVREGDVMQSCLGSPQPVLY